MKNVRIYDNGGKTCDRYTAVYMNCPTDHNRAYFDARGMDARPFHPQGFGQFTIACPGKHLGKRIKFEDLPADCQKLIQEDMK